MTTQSSTPEQDTTYKESILSNCEGLLPEWLELKTRVERTSGLDRALTERYGLVYKQMDRYLQQLFVLGGLAVGGSDETVT